MSPNQPPQQQPSALTPVTRLYCPACGALYDQAPTTHCYQCRVVLVHGPYTPPTNPPLPPPTPPAPYKPSQPDKVTPGEVVMGLTGLLCAVLAMLVALLLGAVGYASHSPLWWLSGAIGVVISICLAMGDDAITKGCGYLGIVVAVVLFVFLR